MYFKYLCLFFDDYLVTIYFVLCKTTFQYCILFLCHTDLYSVLHYTKYYSICIVINNLSFLNTHLFTLVAKYGSADTEKSR